MDSSPEEIPDSTVVAGPVRALEAAPERPGAGPHDRAAVGVHLLHVGREDDVDSLGRDGTADAVVATLVRLARELGMNVVAEGIETEPQVLALAACGVGEGQGYLVSPPVPGPAFLRLLQGAPAGEAQAGGREAA